VNPSLTAAPVAIVAATAGLTVYAAGHPRAQLFGSTICGTNSPSKLAITFDDGPNPAFTPKFLDLLERYHAHATFFFIGRFVRECPALVRETAARGHAIGSHTNTHPNLFWLSPARIKEELTGCNDAISDVTGAGPKWFRPPWGLRNPWVISAARALGQRTVMWSLITSDWRARSSDWLIPRMESIARHGRQLSAGSSNARARGDILCLHDGGHRGLNADRTPTLSALEYWLPRWRDLGFEFVTIDEAVGTPAP
jgi:peptidoglycan/xylan/chitin deacetylase (PgdA/CDA1 family)